MTEPQYDVPVYADAIETYSYQVAGHGALLKIGNKICKPLIPIELSFYKSVKQFPDLLPYTASFHGTIELNLNQDDLQDIMTEIEDRSTSETTTDKGTEVLNPWSAKVVKSQFHNFISLKNSVHKYMVLEDLTRPFKHPCICDMKMGTRQHGDDAPADKRFRHQNKVLTTTSLPLGVRLCGIQNYQITSKSYKYTSKYDGRKLKQDTIKDAIAGFFDNGVTFRLDALSQFVDRLKGFYKVMEGVKDKFRFYSTSLLMVYEGDPDSPPQINIKMIDFAHTFAMAESDVNDDGYLFGLSNLIDLMEQIQKDHNM